MARHRRYSPETQCIWWNDPSEISTILLVLLLQLPSLWEYKLLSTPHWATLYQNLLLSQSYANLLKFGRISRWYENDMGLSIWDKIWEQVLRRIHLSSISARHCVIQCKEARRLHCSEERWVRIFLELDPTCDGCKQNSANLLHALALVDTLSTIWHKSPETSVIFRYCSSWHTFKHYLNGFSGLTLL